MNFNHLKKLESESIHIIREVAAEFKNPVMLYSIGKDSSVMLHLTIKAFLELNKNFSRYERSPLKEIDKSEMLKCKKVFKKIKKQIIIKKLDNYLT